MLISATFCVVMFDIWVDWKVYFKHKLYNRFVKLFDYETRFNHDENLKKGDGHCEGMVYVAVLDFTG